jgi:hypothetical protein
LPATEVARGRAFAVRLGANLNECHAQLNFIPLSGTSIPDVNPWLTIIPLIRAIKYKDLIPSSTAQFSG